MEEKKHWDFSGHASIAIENNQLTWKAASGQAGSYPLPSVSGANYEAGGFLRLIATLQNQLIPVPKTLASEQMVSEIQEYLAVFHEQADTHTSAPGDGHTNSGLTDELAKLDHLKTLGFITEEEFHQMKQKLQL
ncbi:SHOCT domain-containing protein [Hymenobacter crusticola]|uniref:SHOCT domain-containing protein n=1 Tax=Hymenobacter crusticola TaxID=1770526 RepID=A0A243W9Y9_9BACT|nr:SHOCT domain-containing protein [Hymenobacter crusticola]OUJ72358.1 hypothetical protein BXP70_19085 [Hymenobacter crusticola]